MRILFFIFMIFATVNLQAQYTTKQQAKKIVKLCKKGYKIEKIYVYCNTYKRSRKTLEKIAKVLHDADINYGFIGEHVKTKGLRIKIKVILKEE